jgi:hypothetical protein
MAARSRRICLRAWSTRWIIAAMLARRAWIAAAVCGIPSWAVLRAAQVQGQGLVEQAEAGQGLLQPVDRAGGWLEYLVQVVGGGVVGGALGDGPPLLLLAPPVEQVGAGHHELVAVLAVQVPRAGRAVDDGLEGAEPAVGGGAAPRQVECERERLLAGERGKAAAGQQLPGNGRAGAGDPDGVEDVFQDGVGDL